jgi:predicted secreted protein/outer membrane murein-binding lipoprotein Lpp
MKKMNSQRGQVSTIAIVLLVVGLVAGAVGGYFAASNSLQPKIDDYESQVADLNSEVSGLNAIVSSLEDEITDYEATQSASAHILTIYESQVISLREEIKDYESLVNDLELQLNETVSEYIVSDTHIEVEIGQTFTTILESNPTTGFGWQLAKPLNESIVKFIDSQFRTLATEFPPPPGTGGIEIWTFEGTGIGTTEIFMEYLRPWEDAPPVKERTFVVIVK